MTPGDGLPNISTRHLSYKQYEFKDHLGSVRSIISDHKLSDLDGSGNLSNFRANVLSYTNYHPFGLEQAGDSWKSPLLGKYRYGFNGKEKDPN